MEGIVHPVKKIAGQVSVPGERVPAERVLVLAALSEGDSVVGNAPVVVGRVAALLRALGVDIAERAGDYAVRGVGLRGFQRTAAPLDLAGLGDTALLLLPLLAGQTFRSRVKLGAEAERCRPLLAVLTQLGFAVEQEGADTIVTGGQPAKGVRPCRGTADRRLGAGRDGRRALGRGDDRPESRPPRGALVARARGGGRAAQPAVGSRRASVAGR